MYQEVKYANIPVRYTCSSYQIPAKVAPVSNQVNHFIIFSSSMESPNCAVDVQTSSSQNQSSTAMTGRGNNENSLNAALAFQLYTAASSRYSTPRNENISLLRDGYATTPVLRPHIRPFSASLPNPNRSRSLSDILDEAIEISNEILLHDRNDDPREVSSLVSQ